MSDDEFYELMTTDWPTTTKPAPSLLASYASTHWSHTSPVKLCANDRCMKGPDGTRAMVLTGRYCSNACRSSMGRRLPPRSTKPRNSAVQFSLESDQTPPETLHLA